jgi:serine/threonine-protein kinase
VQLTLTGKATMKNDLTGTQIGQYRLIERIGDGTSATVYRAQQISAFGRDVALKVMRPELVGAGDFAERLENEARTIAKLRHPNILRLIEYLAVDDKVCLVMDYLVGGSLTDVIARGHLPLDTINRVCGQMASALDYAHNRNIIHRDLKPHNVLLDESQNAFLSDFGLSKLLSENISLTSSGVIIGTPAYMPPEQWQGLTLDRRADIYAFGILVFEMLTGELPYKADTATGMMYQHLHASPAPVEILREELPPMVNYVLHRALAKSPADRYDSAGAFFSDLREALNGNPAITANQLKKASSSTHDPSTTEVAAVRLPGNQRRTPIIVGVVALVIVVIAVVALLSQQGSPPTPTPTTAALAATPADGTNMNMQQVLVPEGCFNMGGNSATDPDVDDSELPAHQVCLTPFWIDVYEVTNEAYQAFVDAGGYTDPQWWSEDGWRWLQTNGFAGPENRGDSFNGALQPRLNLSWYEADAYARWRGGRLPTEAEWEYAARGTQQRLYAWGDGYQLGYTIINEISRGGVAPTAPNEVGSKTTDRSWSGAFDMVGNVCEWVNDWLTPYTADAAQNPTGAETGMERVIRGGSYISSPVTARLVVRSGRTPESRAQTCGVRVVKSS